MNRESVREYKRERVVECKREREYERERVREREKERDRERDREREGEKERKEGTVDRCSPEEIQNIPVGRSAMDARRTRGRIRDGGKTPKTACRGVVLSSEHNTGHGFSDLQQQIRMRTVVRKFCLTRDLDRGLGAISKKREYERVRESMGEHESVRERESLTLLLSYSVRE